MKKTLVIILVLMVIILYKLNENRDSLPHSSINQVSFIEEMPAEAINPDIKEGLAQEGPITIQAFINEKMALGEAFIKESSYMALFYDYQLSLACQEATDVYGYNFLIPERKLENASDVFFEVNNAENTTAIQLAKWQLFVNDCHSLVKDYDYLLLITDANEIKPTPIETQEIWETGDKSYDNYYDSGRWNTDTSLPRELYKKLKTHQSKTKVEKSLKEAIILTSQYHELKDNTAFSANEKYSIPMNEVERIKNEIELAYIDLDYQYATDSDGETRLADDDTEKRIDYLREYLSSVSEFDEQKFFESKTNFINLHNKLMAKLPSATGHEFKIIIETITQGIRPFDTFEEFSPSLGKYYIQITELNQKFYQDNNINDPQYYTLLIEPMLNMLYCYKGNDCSSDSLVNTKYCLGIGLREASNAACEQNLEDFYFQSFLTENQSIDALSLLNYLVENYAQ